MTTKVSWHCSRKRKHLRIPYVACLAWKEAQAIRVLTMMEQLLARSNYLQAGAELLACRGSGRGEDLDKL